MQSEVAAQEVEEERSRSAIDPRIVEIQFTDDSRLKVRLADEVIVMETPHGKLAIPAGDVRRIEFAVRPTAEEEQRLARSIADLASDDAERLQAAKAQLLDHPGRSFAALEKAAREGTPPLAERAEELLATLREEFSPAELALRSADMLETDDTKVAGRIVAPALKLRTAQFGILEMKLTDARSLKSLALADSAAAEDPEPKGVLPDPGNLKAYETQVGKTFLFKVIGGAHGSLWGTGTYTTDSNLAAAAVHTGILKMGEEGVVQVKIVPSPPSFAGSVQNGLGSSGFGPYPAAYEVSKPKGKRRSR